MKNAFLLTLSLILASCGQGEKSSLSFKVNNLSPIVTETKLTALQKAFNKLNTDVLAPHCIGCHKKANTEEGIAKWIKSEDVEGSKLYAVIKDGRMPKKAPPLSSEKLEIVRQYIEEFSLANPVPKPNEIAFKKLYQEVLLPDCLGCHKRVDKEAGIVMWIVKGDATNSKLYQVIEDGRMPKRAAKLSSEKLNIVREYIESFNQLR